MSSDGYVYVNVYKPIGVKEKSRLKIKKLGVVKLGKEIKLKDIGIQRDMIADNIFCNYYLCNLTGEFITSHVKLPVLYGNIDYIKKLTSRQLMRIYLFFTVNIDVEKSRSDIVGKPLYGKYSIELELNGDIETLDIEVPVFTTKNKLISIMTEYLRKPESLEVLKMLITEIDEKRAEEAKDLNYISKIPQVTITKEDINRIKKNLK